KFTPGRFVSRIPEGPRNVHNAHPEFNPLITSSVSLYQAWATSAGVCREQPNSPKWIGIPCFANSPQGRNFASSFCLSQMIFPCASLRGHVGTGCLPVPQRATHGLPYAVTCPGT